MAAAQNPKSTYMKHGKSKKKKRTGTGISPLRRAENLEAEATQSQAHSLMEADSGSDNVDLPEPRRDVISSWGSEVSLESERDRSREATASTAHGTGKRTDRSGSRSRDRSGSRSHTNSRDSSAARQTGRGGNHPTGREQNKSDRSDKRSKARTGPAEAETGELIVSEADMLGLLGADAIEITSGEEEEEPTGSGVPASKRDDESTDSWTTASSSKKKKKKHARGARAGASAKAAPTQLSQNTGAGAKAPKPKLQDVLPKGTGARPKVLPRARSTSSTRSVDALDDPKKTLTGVFRCPGCTQSFKDASGMRNHYGFCQLYQMHLCPAKGCSEFCCRTSLLKQHFVSAHGNLPRADRWEELVELTRRTVKVTNFNTPKEKVVLDDGMVGFTHKSIRKGLTEPAFREGTSPRGPSLFVMIRSTSVARAMERAAKAVTLWPSEAPGMVPSNETLTSDSQSEGRGRSVVRKETPQKRQRSLSSHTATPKGEAVEVNPTKRPKKSTPKRGSYSVHPRPAQCTEKVRRDCQTFMNLMYRECTEEATEDERRAREIVADTLWGIDWMCAIQRGYANGKEAAKTTVLATPDLAEATVSSSEEMPPPKGPPVRGPSYSEVVKTPPKFVARKAPHPKLSPRARVVNIRALKAWVYQKITPLSVEDRTMVTKWLAPDIQSPQNTYKAVTVLRDLYALHQLRLDGQVEAMFKPFWVDPMGPPPAHIMMRLLGDSEPDEADFSKDKLETRPSKAREPKVMSAVRRIAVASRTSPETQTTTDPGYRMEKIDTVLMPGQGGATIDTPQDVRYPVAGKHGDKWDRSGERSGRDRSYRTRGRHPAPSTSTDPSSAVAAAFRNLQPEALWIAEDGQSAAPVLGSATTAAPVQESATKAAPARESATVPVDRTGPSPRVSQDSGRVSMDTDLPTTVEVPPRQGFEGPAPGESGPDVAWFMGRRVPMIPPGMVVEGELILPGPAMFCVVSLSEPMLEGQPAVRVPFEFVLLTKGPLRVPDGEITAMPTHLRTRNELQSLAEAAFARRGIYREEETTDQEESDSQSQTQDTGPVGQGMSAAADSSKEEQRQTPEEVRATAPASEAEEAMEIQGDLLDSTAGTDPVPTQSSELEPMDEEAIDVEADDEEEEDESEEEETEGDTSVPVTPVHGPDPDRIVEPAATVADFRLADATTDMLRLELTVSDQDVADERNWEQMLSDTGSHRDSMLSPVLSGVMGPIFEADAAKVVTAPPVNPHPIEVKVLVRPRVEGVTPTGSPVRRRPTPVQSPVRTRTPVGSPKAAATSSPRRRTHEERLVSPRFPIKKPSPASSDEDEL